MNQFYSIGLFLPLSPLKILGNQTFSVFRWYRKRIIIWNEFNTVKAFFRKPRQGAVGMKKGTLGKFRVIRTWKTAKQHVNLRFLEGKNVQKIQKEYCMTAMSKISPGSIINLKEMTTEMMLRQTWSKKINQSDICEQIKKEKILRK